MSDYIHLKPENYYESLYDRYTVEQCRLTEKIFLGDLKSASNISRKQKLKFLDLVLYFKTGERFVSRATTIYKWMEEDRLRDEKIANTPIPTNIICKFCETEMEVGNKSLEVRLDNKPERVEFLFRCERCHIGKRIFDDGTVIDIIPWKCPDCSRKLQVNHKNSEDKLITTKTCEYCGYKNKDSIELRKSGNEDYYSEKEKKSFNIDLDRFCLSKANGDRYIENKRQMERMTAIMEEIKNSDNQKPEPSLIMLTMFQLEELLHKKLEDSKYVKLSMAQPEIRKEVIVEFTVQDSSDRGEYESRKQLKEVITSSLKGVNWRLMSEGVSYRLGVLSGRLRGEELKKG